MNMSEDYVTERLLHDFMDLRWASVITNRCKLNLANQITWGQAAKKEARLRSCGEGERVDRIINSVANHADYGNHAYAAMVEESLMKEGEDADRDRGTWNEGEETRMGQVELALSTMRDEIGMLVARMDSFSGMLTDLGGKVGSIEKAIKNAENPFLVPVVTPPSGNIYTPNAHIVVPIVVPRSGEPTRTADGDPVRETQADTPWKCKPCRRCGSLEHTYCGPVPIPKIGELSHTADSGTPVKTVKKDSSTYLKW